MNSKKVILTPITMVRPSKDFVQAPSRIRPEIEMSQEEFSEIADTAKTSLVSMESDGISNAKQVTAYSVPIKVQSGLKGWIARCIVTEK